MRPKTTYLCHLGPIGARLRDIGSGTIVILGWLYSMSWVLRETFVEVMGCQNLILLLIGQMTFVHRSIRVLRVGGVLGLIRLWYQKSCLLDKILLCARVSTRRGMTSLMHLARASCLCLFFVCEISVFRIVLIGYMTFVMHGTGVAFTACNRTSCVINS